MAVPTFVDRVTLHVSAGRGGNGVASVHREKFKPLGGPDGGNGGPGGSVILRVDPDVTTLLDYHHSPRRKAENGAQGAGGNRNGSHGGDLVLPVPDGTVVHEARSGEVLADMVGAGTELVIARGGRGGLGNAALASAKRKAPGFALLGEPGDELEIRLELKVVADIGLVGFPSAGKSSLIAAMSRARPKIADYPFTTLVPNLGVVTAGETTFTVADVPGLIEGASEGRGLGHDFLRHVERCAAIVHVIDTATLEPGRNPVEDLDIIENELSPLRRPRRPAAPGRAEQGRRARRLRDRRHGGRRPPRAWPRRLQGVGGQRVRAARADVRDGRDREGRTRRTPAGPGRADHHPPAVGRRQRRLHRHRDRRGLAGARREARALGAPDRLRQRRGRRVPRRPAQPARRREASGRGGSPGGRRRPHRSPRRRRGLRLQAQHRGRRRDPRSPRRGPAVRRGAPRGAATPRDRRGDGRQGRERVPRRRRSPARRAAEASAPGRWPTRSAAATTPTAWRTTSDPRGRSSTRSVSSSRSAPPR